MGFAGAAGMFPGSVFPSGRTASNLLEADAEMVAHIDKQLDDGTKIDASKSYRVAGWATVGSQSLGAPIWDGVGEGAEEKR